MADTMVQYTVRGEEGVMEMLAQKLSPTVRIAAASGMNRTAEEVLGHQSNRIQREMTVRVPGFVLPPTKLPGVWKATPDKLHVLIALGDQRSFSNRSHADIGGRRARMLSKFGAAQQKVAKDPKDWPIAIPTPSLNGDGTMRIPKRMYPRNLVGKFNGDGGFTGLGRKARMVNRKGKRKGQTVIRQRQVGRYFVIGNVNWAKGWGLYQRTGEKRDDIVMIWKFKKSVPIPKLLDFEADASRIINERAARDFANAFEQAVAGRIR
jgi:hypothetical protein